MAKTITFFTCGGLEEPSGIGRYFPLAKELTKRGFQIHYLALHPDFSSAGQKYFVKEGVHVHFVGQMHVLKKGDQKYYFSRWPLFKVTVASTWNMILTALSIKADILYCFKPQPINGLAAVVTKILKAKPLILDCDDYEAALNKLTKFQKHIFTFFEDTLMPRCARKITYHTTFLKDRYLKLGYREDKFVLLPNGADRERFANIPPEKVAALRDGLKLHGKKVILYVGSLSLGSGHAIDLLLKAFEEIHYRRADTVLLLVGGGEDIDSLRKQMAPAVADSVIFAGRIPSGDIPAYISLADISADPVRDVPANKGRSPLKIFESMALGVPVVTSDIGDRRLIIGENKAGVLARLGDAQALAQAMIDILSDNGRARSLRQGCLELIQEYYWDRLTDRLLTQVEILRDR